MTVAFAYTKLFLFSAKGVYEMADLQETRKKTLPVSDEVAAAAHNAEATIELVRKYQLTAVELSELIERLPNRAVPW